ncbi:MAG TPA: hypothetical protein PKA88_08410 [Polyangiaceae bacterium]|nr:hypothetical protein [Polyangiaceae bacterium]
MAALAKPGKGRRVRSTASASDSIRPADPELDWGRRQAHQEARLASGWIERGRDARPVRRAEPRRDGKLRRDCTPRVWMERLGLAIAQAPDH